MVGVLWWGQIRASWRGIGDCLGGGGSSVGNCDKWKCENELVILVNWTGIINSKWVQLLINNREIHRYLHVTRVDW